jgi:hypothetical protein
METGVDEGDPLQPTEPPPVKVVHVKADPGFAEAARGFLDTWLIRKDYDAAFRYLSTRSYACYDLMRGPEAPPSTSPDDAGRKVRASLQAVGEKVGAARNLESILAAAEPVHPSIRVMDHANSGTFSLSSVPDALGDAFECEARAKRAVPPDPMPLEYGKAFGLMVRFRTTGGEAAVLRLLWRKEDAAWRITSYDVELP